MIQQPKQRRAMVRSTCFCVAILLVSCLPAVEGESESFSSDSEVAASLSVPQGFAFTTTRKVRLSLAGELAASLRDTQLSVAQGTGHVLYRGTSNAMVNGTLYIGASIFDEELTCSFRRDGKTVVVGKVKVDPNGEAILRL